MRRLESRLGQTKLPGSSSEWLARLAITLAPWATAVFWIFARPSLVSLAWTLMYSVATGFVLWSTRDGINTLNGIEPDIDALAGTRDALGDLLDPPQAEGSRLLCLLGSAGLAMGITCAVDWVWLRGPLDLTWHVTVGWTAFWVMGTFWGTRGGIRAIARNLYKNAPDLQLIRHAPGRTPGLVELRGLLARLATRSGLIIFLVTAPLAWGTFLAKDAHRADASVLIGVDALALAGLAFWLAYPAYRTNHDLMAIARGSRDSTLRDLARRLPRATDEMIDPDGHRVIELYQRVATEPLGQIDRRSRIVAYATTLGPTLVGLAKAVSLFH